MSSRSPIAALGAVCAAFSANLALAQPAPAAQSTAAMPAASMPHDCKARHDHMGEKGMPTPKSAVCADASASAAKTKTKGAPRHDHAKFHKNQG